MKKGLRALPLLLAILAGPGCHKPDAELNRVVARIGEDEITRSEMIALLKELPPRVQARYATQEGLVRLLEETLDKRAQEAEARRLGLDKDPVVRDKIATYVEQKTSALDQQIESLKEQRRELAEKAPREILSSELFDLRTRNFQETLSDEELRAAYKEWKEGRLAAEPKADLPPFEVVRKDLVQELVKKKVRAEIRRSAGVTIYSEALAAP